MPHRYHTGDIHLEPTLTPVMRRVIIESPYAGETARNVAYAQAAMYDCLRRGEAPFASHLLYTQVLNDLIPSDRALGIAAGLAWAAAADAVIIYTDLGVTDGMEQALTEARAAGRVVEYRHLGWKGNKAADNGESDH